MRGSIAGISDGRGYHSPPNNHAHSMLLEFIDILISSSIIAPCVISYWRGTWDLMEHYIIPYNQVYSATASFLIGIIGHMIFTLLQKFLRNNFNPDKHRLTFYTFSRLYTAIFGAICVNGWRGAWLLTDIYTGFQLHIVILVTSTAILLLAAMRASRNLIAAPFALAIDQSKDYFDITTMFKTSSTDEPGLFVLDCVFSIAVPATLVVVAWRGLWVILDLTLYPDNKTLSAWGSLIIGYAVVAFTFAIQPIVRWICDRINGIWRIATADIFLLISFIGTVNVWRGIWHLLDIYFLPDNRLASDWITHAVSFIVLTLMKCSNSVLVRGIFIDAEEPAGECVIFPIFYVRLFFKNERDKKHQKLFMISAIDKQQQQQQDQNSTMFLLDKITVAHNNIKIVKSSNKINPISNIQNPESKPMLSQSVTTPQLPSSLSIPPSSGQQQIVPGITINYEKTKNGSH